MSASESRPRDYVLGTHDEELRRLGFQHRVWGAQTFNLWQRAGIGAGATVLDVGCGPGFAALDLARLVLPQGRIIAVDQSARFLDHLRAHAAADALDNITVIQADVQKLDLPPASVDHAYCRWVLCFVADPAAVVQNVARAMRPGGTFAIQDYFNYKVLSLAPRSPILEKIALATDKSWRLRGGDPDIAGRLPGLLADAEFVVREIRPQVRVARPGDVLWEWPATFFLGYLSTLLEMGLITPQDKFDFEREWAQRSKDPNTFFSTPPVYEIIAERK